MSKTQVFIVCFILTILSFNIGFIASYRYDKNAGKPPSERQSAAKTYALSLPDPMPFGKHKGKLIRDVLNEKPGYLRWMRDNVQRVTFAEDVLQQITAK